MNFAQPNQITHSEVKVTQYNSTILLAGAALAVVFLVVIYLAAMGPGTAPDELASMIMPP
jgi:hypothetical protein